MNNQNVPVYLFTGFLEAGKTRMIQEALEDKNFNDGCKILLIVCEEGMEEYDATRFWGQNVRQVVVEKESDLTPALLAKWNKEFRIDRVMVEYNGMWKLETLYGSLPRGWFLFQEVLWWHRQTAAAGKYTSCGAAPRIACQAATCRYTRS